MPGLQQDTPTFNTREDAEQWMVDTVDDGCIDNYRFAYVDDDYEMMKYSNQQFDGCCGAFDMKVVVGGREAMIGCNYGH